MTKTIAIKVAAFSALGLGMVGGLVGAVGADSISTEGPDSPINVRHRSNFDLRNDNNLRVTNNNNQDADSGDAKVEDNTTGGDATSGNARNSNSTGVDALVSNSNGCGCVVNGDGWDLSTEGPDSPIRLRVNSNVVIRNDNNIQVTNNNTQDADSGDAKVEHNTTGGDATSGDAENENSTEIILTVEN